MSQSSDETDVFAEFSLASGVFVATEFTPAAMLKISGPDFVTQDGLLSTARRPAMTYISIKFAYLALVAAFIGCDSSPGVCPCPSGDAVVTVPVTPDATIQSVAVDAPCSAQIAADQSYLFVSRENSGICQVGILLTNGDTYCVSVEFKGGSGCCNHSVFAVGQPTLTLVDAGTGR
jgi:hypothetical protein